MPDRKVLYFDIADRQHELRDTAAPDDFVLARRENPLPFPAGALAHCADMQSERVLFSLHGDQIQALFQAPFLYAAQLRGARHIVTVPFEQLTALHAGVDCRPTLIFSPGRAGSTLLARLLLACGAPCASEPDMLTQVCRFGREERMRIGLDMERSLLRSCLAALCRTLGPTPFVKLRSHCNARPLPLLEASSGTRPVLLMRRLESWALSRHRTFGESAPTVAAMLRHTMDAADKLLDTQPSPQILWFEDLRAEPIATLCACLPGLSPDPATVDRVMQADSQAGTAVSRSQVATAATDPDFAAAFAAAWSRARLGAQWSPATLALLEKADPPE